MRPIVSYFFILSFIAFLSSPTYALSKKCSSEEVEEMLSNFEVDENDYAKLFSIYYIDELTSLVHLSHFDQYLWISSDNSKQSPCENFLEVIPSQTYLASLSSTHTAFLAELQALEMIVAVDQKKHIYNRDVREKIKAKEIIELGFPPDAEKYLDSQANLVSAFVVSDKELEIGALAKVEKNIVLITEFLEQHPLARAEWIKIFGLMSDKYEKAKDQFLKIKKNYKSVKKDSKDFGQISVMTGSLMGDHWEASALNSDFVQMIKDLGATYLFNERAEQGRIRLSKEELVLKLNQKEVNIWIPLGQQKSLEEIYNQDRFYQQFKGASPESIWNPVLRVRSSGANDFWERGNIRPDLVLAELKSIMELEAIENNEKTDKESYWFEKLK